MLRREFLIHSWDEATIALAINYLSSRNFVNVQVSTTSTGAVVTAKRGNWLGNLLSFDMTKLLTKMRLTGETTGKLVLSQSYPAP